VIVEFDMRAQLPGRLYHTAEKLHSPLTCLVTSNLAESSFCSKIAFHSSESFGLYLRVAMSARSEWYPIISGDLALISTRSTDGSVTAEVARRQSDGHGYRSSINSPLRSASPQQSVPTVRSPITLMSL
jgi:hypothetical protein